MKKINEYQLMVIKEAYENKTEVLLDSFGRVTTEEELDYTGDSCSCIVEVKPKDTLERFIKRIEMVQEDLDEAVYEAAYRQGMVW